MTLGLPEYLESKISPEPMSGCWLWTGALNENGYAVVWDKTQKRMRGAYNVVCETVGKLCPEGLEPDHTCRLRCCVNYEHVEHVTHQTNMLRGTSFSALNAVKTHCKHGHSLADAYMQKNGSRQCRTCHKARVKKYAKGKL